MADHIKETDKEVLKRIIAHPTFKEIAEAARQEHAKREKRIFDELRAASDSPTVPPVASPTQNKQAASGS
jgi:hypothetical protein